MRRYLLSFFFLFIFSLLLSIFPNSVFGQAADSQFWVRLKSETVQINGKILKKLSTGTIAQKPDHEIYIAECIDTTDDRVCTTGTKEGDDVIYQSDENLKKMKSLFQYVFRGIYKEDMKTNEKNPIKTNQNGEIATVYWDSQIKDNVVRKFYGVNIIKLNEMAQIKDDNGLGILKTGNEGGQQQGTFLVKAPPKPTPVAKVEIVQNIPQQQGAAPAPAALPEGTRKEKDEREIIAPCEARGEDCKDPYGRVFDAVSLEPIPNAKVILYRLRKDNEFTQFLPKETTNAIINPWMTKEDGKFVFMVPSGIYRLETQISNYTFPFTPKDLNPNYSKAYYELYYGNGFTDQNIIEIKTIEHRDIPVVPKGEPYRAPVKLLGYVSELNKQKQLYEVTGRTSHPLTIVEVLGKRIDTGDITRSLVKTIADKWGFFNAIVSTAELKSDEIVGMAKLTKVDLTEEEKPIAQRQPSLFISFIEKLFNVVPRSSSFAEKETQKKLQFTINSINPLLNYLEGYAYDTKKNTLPRATVGIIPRRFKKAVL